MVVTGVTHTRADKRGFGALSVGVYGADRKLLTWLKKIIRPHPPHEHPPLAPLGGTGGECGKIPVIIAPKTA